MDKFILITLFSCLIIMSTASAFDFSGTTTSSTINYFNITNGTVFNHNELEGIQGGVANEYYHIRQSWYNELSSDIFNWTTQTEVLSFNYYNSTDFSISSYIPYTGSTQNIDLGANDFKVNTNAFFVNSTSGNIGIGETSPETLTEWSSTTPYLTLHNTAHEDTDYGRESELIFKGEQSGGEETTLGKIQVAHDGTADDQKGIMSFKVNDGTDADAPGTAMTILANGKVGIGTTEPDSILHIYNTVDYSGFTIDRSTSTIATDIRFATAGVRDWVIRNQKNSDMLVFGENDGGIQNRLAISVGGLVTVAQNLVVSGTGDTTIAGNVGIGTTNPLSKLQVAGDIHLQNDIDKLYFGQAKDVSIEMNATTFNILDEVGSIVFNFLGFSKYVFSGDVEVAGEINATNINLDKYGVSAYLNESALTTTTSADTWYPINGTFINEIAEGFWLNITVPTDPSIVYNGTETQYFDIHWSATVSSDTPATTIHISAKDGVDPDNWKMGTLCKTAGEPYFLGGVTSLELTQGDRVQLVLESDQAGAVINTLHFTTTIRESFA